MGQQYTGVKREPIETYPSGANRSSRDGKGRFDLISPLALTRLARHYENGAREHGERNWEGGFPISRCVDSALRHLSQYLAGDRSEDHLAAVAWQMFCALHFEEQIVLGRLPAELADVPNVPALWISPSLPRSALTPNPNPDKL